MRHLVFAFVLTTVTTLAGCAGARATGPGPTVIFLDGSGWAGSAGRVAQGLRAAGFRGHVESFPWTAALGPAPDHFLVGHKKTKAEALARRIVERRRQFPRDELHLMGLSAGSAVVVFALEALPRGVDVDNVVLFEPSISGDYDLSAAMQHVGGFLYATSSPHDGVLAGVRLNADGDTGQPAGLYGLRVPSDVQRYESYARVVNLPWRPPYAKLGWSGSHTGVTNSTFVREVIAPRVLSNGPQPLNRPLAPDWIVQWDEDQAAGRPVGSVN
jgi:pimeloyl-ACP methyl ester carboxylesterase